MRLLSFKEAIREAQEQLLNDQKVFILGEGVGDPKNIFGTTSGLKCKFPDRVFDSPISENGITGICIGAAINGMRPILVHQRIDFSLYSMDQIVNNAAKWFSMFGGQRNCPITIRMIIGRGWGQGNQHSQNLTSMYAHIPGIKIVCPSNAHDAKGLLISAVKDPNPVLFIEHRWLYDTTSEVPEYEYEIPIGSTKIINGDKLTIVASGHAYREAFYANECLNQKGIYTELIDLRTIKPLPMDTIHKSVEKTGKLLVVDDCWKTCGLAGEIIASIVEKNPKIICKRLTYPDYYSGSSPGLTSNYYIEASDIAGHAEVILGLQPHYWQRRLHHDVPNESFKGPF